MSFDEKLEKIEESYLTAGMQGRASGGIHGSSIQPKHASDVNTSQNSEQGVDDAGKVLADILVRAGDQEDTEDVDNEFMEYINKAGLDHNNLKGTMLRTYNNMIQNNEQ